MSMRSKLVQLLGNQRFRRYLLVGGGAFLAEYGSFLILFSGFRMWLWLANGSSFCIGLATSFLLNRLWVFSSHVKKYEKRAHHQLAFYAGLSLINLMLTLLLVAYFKREGIDPRIGKILASGLTSIWNFILFKAFIFRHLEPQQGQ